MSVLDLPEEYPASFDEKALLLDGVLESGLKKLLEVVRNKNYTEAPYGRNVNPSPLMTEEQFLLDGCLGDEDPEPKFDFEYGFNPVTFLADYLRWSHPDSVKERRMEKIRSVERLNFRAAHAEKQLQTSTKLRSTALQQGSGILWGPFTTILSRTSILCAVQALKPGKLILQICEEPTFSSTPLVKEEEVAEPATDSTDILTSMVTVTDLKPNTNYYIRCFMDGINPEPDMGNLEEEVEKLPQAEEEVKENDEIKVEESKNGTNEGSDETKFDGANTENAKDKMNDLFLTQNACFMMPASNEETLTEGNVEENLDSNIENNTEIYKCDPVSIAVIPADFSEKSVLSKASLANSGVALTCLVGDPFPTGSQFEENGGTIDSWNFYVKSRLMNDLDSICRNSTLQLGWNDTRYGSDVDVRSEEVTYKQYMHDMKRYNKKYGAGGKRSNSKAPPAPVHTRPSISTSLASLTSSFPVTVTEEGSARHMYNSLSLGPYIEVFMVDSRRGYILKDEAKWLKEEIGKSSAVWKVVVTGNPIAITANDTDTDRVGTPTRGKSRTLSAVEGIDEGGAPRVHVQESTPEQDVDDKGRPKNSLQYLIFSLQRTAERQKRESAAQALDEDDTETITSITGAEDVQSEDESLDVNDNEGVPNIDKILIDSGIIFISSNPINLSLPHVPYIASFDPAETGSAYCAEINIGSSASSVVNQHQYKNVDHMNTSFVHGEAELQAVSSHTNEHTALLSLTEKGDLLVKVCSLSQDNNIITQKLFSVNSE